jgi:drug/metabolite transporter (DMT)-like permease
MSHNALNRGAVGVGRTARRVIVIATAAVANGLAWVGGQHAHVDYVVQTPFGGREITLSLVITATLVSGLAGWAVFSLLERHTSNTGRAWIALAALVLTLSIVPIFVLQADLATRLTLTALHCIVAAILIAGLPQTRRRTTAWRAQ